MTITSQQVDAWDAAVDAAYEAGRQEGMKQERALRELSGLGQEIEAQPERPWVELTEVDILAASKHWRHAEDFMAGVYWAAGTLKEFNT